MRLVRTLPVLIALALTAPARADDAPMPVHKVTQLESFVMVEPMYATIIDADRPCGLLLVAIGLDIPNAELRGTAEHALPILRDAYLRNLMTYTAANVRPWRQPDVNEISARLQRVTDRALKKTGARVLLSQVAIRITR
ncbi:MAG TPA: hypothetical protein VGT78_14955 [Rhizomicrobium sp.]|nr:hypothetical protein [Rhizomicrobium sp.]